MNRLLILVFLLNNLQTYGQGSDTLALVKPIEQLRQTGDSLLAHQYDSSGTEWNSRFRAGLEALLALPGGLQLSYKQVKALSVVRADNGKIKLLTWMLPDRSRAAFNFFGFVIVEEGKKEKKMLRLYRLHHRTDLKREDLEFLKSDTTNWTGCVYYDIIRKRYRKKEYYVLLGWAPQNAYVTRKLIEPIVFSGQRLQLGAPVLKAGGKTRTRLVYEFNARASMSLRYDSKKDMIIMDHLAPSDPRPEAAGMYQLYGPDLSYDALDFRKGMWVLIRDIDVTN